MRAGLSSKGSSGTPGTRSMRKRRVPNIPSFFFVMTLKLPGVRFPIPVVIPLFVLEDLLESAAIAVNTFGFIHPLSRRKIQCSTMRYKGFSGWDVRNSITLPGGFELFQLILHNMERHLPSLGIFKKPCSIFEESVTTPR
jgi:hypothetical protein